jgi:hypothetical protein
MGREPTLSIITKAAGMATGTAMGLALAIGVTSTAVPTQPAEATVPLPYDGPTVQSDNPPCGYDVYRGKVYITSLGKAHGTARVSLQSKRYSYISTNVGTKRIKRGQSITIKPSKRIKANRITVDIVKGKLTKDETPRRKVWKCEAA